MPVPRTAPTPSASSMPARPYPGSAATDQRPPCRDGLARGRDVFGAARGTWRYAANEYVIEFSSLST